MTSAANVQATFCATLVDEWVRHGVVDAVVCPGSRSTPLALALAGDERMRVHVHHDERAAGFMALGMALDRGWPVVVLTTSGTAAVELHPAVMEASMAGVPMIVCTADRPAELRDVGAPQTIDQTHLYGRAVRWFSDPGVPDDGSRHAWRSLAARSARESISGRPGPVHLNLPFREPLVGDPGELPPDAGVPPLQVDAGDAGAGRAEMAQLTWCPRGLIVAGSHVGDPVGVATLAEVTGWPVVADPRSGCRVPAGWTVAAFDAILRHEGFASGHMPEVVVRLGSPPASRVLATWLASTGARQVAVDAHGAVYDPERTASWFVRAEPGAWCRGVASDAARSDDRTWQSEWKRAEVLAQRAFDDVLARHQEATEPGVARGLSGLLPNGTTLMVGSSMPVRDLEWYAAPREGVRVLSNRGANGIDGVVSSAVGAAAAGGSVAVLVGDVSFLHDSNALLGLRDRGLDLTIVVVDNRGGGIFSFLPQATSVAAERFELLFGTPHDVDLAALGAAHGIPTVTVDRADALVPAVADAYAAPGTNVIVVRTDRAANVAVHDELHAAVAAALDHS